MIDKRPKWQKELESFKGIKSTFIIEGNINDLYPFYEAEAVATTVTNYIELDWLLIKIFKILGNSKISESQEEKENELKYDFIFCNPVLGFYNKDIRENVADILKKYDKSDNSIFKENTSSNYKIDDIEAFSDIIKKVITTKGERPAAVVINFAARYISSPNSLDTSENNMFINLLESSIGARIVDGYVNTLILVVEKFNDLPSWFYYNNPNVRTITIPNPDKNMRQNYIEKIYENELKDDFESRDKFIDNTEGLKNRELKMKSVKLCFFWCWWWKIFFQYYWSKARIKNLRAKFRFFWNCFKKWFKCLKNILRKWTFFDWNRRKKVYLFKK